MIFESKDAYTAYDIYYKEYLNIVKNYKDYNTLGHLDLIKDMVLMTKF